VRRESVSAGREILRQLRTPTRCLIVGG